MVVFNLFEDEGKFFTISVVLLYLLLTKRQTETNNSASAIFKWSELKNVRVVDIEINAWSLSFINNKINLISVLYPEKGMQFNQWSILYMYIN